MKSNRLVGIGLVFLLVSPCLAIFGSPRLVGIVVGDKIVFSYKYEKFEPSLLGNVSSFTVVGNQTISIRSLDSSKGIVGYDGVAELRNVTGSTPITVLLGNSTTLFDPFDNSTYTGRLGFPAFTYLDVPNGTRNVYLTIPIVGGPPTNSSQTPQNISVNVIRTPRQIGINFTDTPWKGAIPFHAFEVFDPKSGVLTKMTMHTYLFGVYRFYYYKLLSLTHTTPPDLLPAAYLAAGAVIAGAIVVIWRRPSRLQKKVKKVRERYSRR